MLEISYHGGMSTTLVSLHYGSARPLECPLDSSRLRLNFVPPPPLPGLAERAVDVLENPLEFPALRHAIVPGDRITIVLDLRVPQADLIVAEVLRVLTSQGVRPEDVLILQPADSRGLRARDPRGALPPEIATAVTWKTHDPTVAEATAYLASTASGERIYLNKELLDSDFTLVVGVTSHDPVLGYRGTGSAIYPGLSTTEAIRKAVGQGHDELGPDESRPIRQWIDEIQWLMGLQFVVQVIPGADGMASGFLAGSTEAVFREARSALKAHWQVSATERAELVVVSIDEPAARQSWFEIGSALDVARRLVSKDGRIVVLSQLQTPLTEGMEILRSAHKPREAIKPLRERQPMDLIPATQIAQALDWANVYLLSRLPGDVVEDLCMVPLAEIREVERLLESVDDIIVLGAAQHVSVKASRS